jgi:hypothetical protein
VSNEHHHPDLERLRARLQEKPRTKAGQVRQAWPYIRELIAAGHTRKDIRTWLSEVGIEVGYKRLCNYIGRLSRSEQQALPAATQPTTTKHQERASRRPRSEPAPDEPRRDPLANAREREHNRPGFHYNPEPDPKKLI